MTSTYDSENGGVDPKVGQTVTGDGSHAPESPQPTSPIEDKLLAVRADCEKVLLDLQVLRRHQDETMKGLGLRLVDVLVSLSLTVNALRRL